MTLNECVEEVISRGLDDWVQAAEVASIAKVTGGARLPEDTRRTSLAIIRKVLEGGLMVAGDLTNEGFRPWDQQGSAAAERIAREWSALGRTPHLWELFWLENTPKGDALARS